MADDAGIAYRQKSGFPSFLLMKEFGENEKKIRSVQFLEDGSIIEQVYSGTEPEEQ